MFLTVTEKYDGGSVRDFLKTGHGFSSRLFSCLKKADGIKLNGIPVRPGFLLKAGDRVEIIFPEVWHGVQPKEGKIDILYEDEFLLGVNKPAPMPCHPSAGHYEDTLANYVAAYFESRGLKTAIRIPGRLDSGTTGVVLIAKNEFVAEKLSSFTLKGEIKKKYLCVAEGLLPEKGEIDLPIGRCEDSIIKRCVRQDGKAAKTVFRRITAGEDFSAAEVEIHTGRTHQIRVHMAHIGHPLVGDWLYGKEIPEQKRHLLHLWKTEFFHPVTKEKICIEAPIPEDIKSLMCL